ncbi:class I SAM-dependent methyltransferase [Bacillus tianshenii]|nr:class I SAM-dependent methyltransferase [Bacillus tianshenii]
MLALFFEQFAKPRGWFGWIIGKVLATSNQDINEWTISLLDIQQNDNILEIGYGPGKAIQYINDSFPTVFIAGIDYSDVMFEQAKNENHKGIEEGKIDLYQGDVKDLPNFGCKFNKVFSVNNYTLWEDNMTCLRNIHAMLQPKGQIAITLQPRAKGATDNTTEKVGDKIMNDLIMAGFSDVKLKIKETKPTDTVSVIGKKD